jgi:acyl-CoA synthetase (NDP forming)
VGQTPQLEDVDAGAANAITKAFLGANPDGGWLSPDDAVAMLRAFGIATALEVEVASAEAAAAAALQLGGPVALKAMGATILHKSDVGGVRLDLSSPDDVAKAYSAMAGHLGDAMEGAIVQPMLRGVELIAGVVTDPLFGPVVMFGSGGTAVELFGDRVLRILPLTDQDAHEMVRSIRGAPLLFGHRGAPACDVVAVEDILLRIARLADEVPQLSEMDLNPLIASPSGAVAVDVRIRLAPWRRHAETEVRRLR